ncbi:MAG: DUF262 domain-containing protein [Ruminococcus sp.]|nr:DUF262 domain-containing protein [Ruminococcus sp.]
MSKLNIDQKTIEALFSDPKTDFLIPDYQRPYAWSEVECRTLWDDIFSFAFPENNSDNFKTTDEYFLGPIVTFKNEDGKQEIIDGQQRLTTLMLLLRAFYARFGKMKDASTQLVQERVEKCIWKKDELGAIIKTQLKIDSEVATDVQKDQFLSILKNGDAPDSMKSQYAVNYRFFQAKINEFLNDYPTYFAYLPARLINNCILLPIEAESQDTALRIFSTLNDRGMPLSDSDIFKAQYYKFYSSQGKKDDFIKKWKELEELSNKIFHPISGIPMDELFTRYMYYERAKQGIKSSTTEALRKFYEKNSYSLLKSEETFENLRDLADFWNDVSNQSKDRFSEKILRKLFVLNYAPNGMWYYFVSVYYLHNRDAEGNLDDDAFDAFLEKIIAFIWTYAVINPGVNMLRTPVYAEMVNVVNDKPVSFDDFKFDIGSVKAAFLNFSFNNARPITKAMLAWWAFLDESQELLSLETVFEIEHIYAKNRQDKEKSLTNTKNLEALGNKAMLEKRINIRASDYRFEDKKKYYNGYINSRKQEKKGTKINELLTLAKNNDDFIEADIINRSNDMIERFMQYIVENELAQ